MRNVNARLVLTYSRVSSAILCALRLTTMPQISHDFPVFAPAARVFENISTPAGLDRWWTKTSSGLAELGAEWELGFGPEYQWHAVVSQCLANREFELTITHAHPYDRDWRGTRVGFELEEREGGKRTDLSFYHHGWPQANEHYRISCYCWAMYLRLLKRYIEHRETVPYEKRLDV